MSILDRNEQVIHDAFSQITVDASKLAGQVKSRLEGETPVAKPRRVYWSMSAAAIIVISVMVVGTATAMALGGFDWFIEKFNPTFGKVVEPVEVYSIDQGIRMEVIGAQKYDNMAMVYLALQDISGQNRLTEHTDFRDGFFVTMNLPKDMAGEGEGISSGFSWNQKLLYFDEKTNTLYFEFNITADANSPLSDPLEVGSFLIYFDEREYNNEPVDLSPSGMKEAEVISIKKEQIWGWSGSVNADDRGFLTKVLAPGNFAPMPHGEADQWISNMGVLDGRLRVQVGMLWNREFGSNNASLSLRTPEGKLIEPDYELNLFGDDNYSLLSSKEIDYDDAKYTYQEIIFPVNTGELDGYTLLYTGAVYTGVEGRWKVAANLSDTNHQMRIVTNDIPVEDHLFKHMILSPLGIQVNGSYTSEECLAGEMSLAVETMGGIISLKAGGGSSNAKTQTFNFYWNTETPLDINTVRGININNIHIPVRKQVLGDQE